jgi:hypothetical protein
MNVSISDSSDRTAQTVDTFRGLEGKGAKSDFGLRRSRRIPSRMLNVGQFRSSLAAATRFAAGAASASVTCLAGAWAAEASDRNLFVHITFSASVERCAVMRHRIWSPNLSESEQFRPKSSLCLVALYSVLASATALLIGAQMSKHHYVSPDNRLIRRAPGKPHRVTSSLPDTSWTGQT